MFIDGKSQIENTDGLYDSTPETEKWLNNEEIQIFRKYLTYPTISLEADFGNIHLKMYYEIKYNASIKKRFDCRAMRKFSQKTSE